MDNHPIPRSAVSSQGLQMQLSTAVAVRYNLVVLPIALHEFPVQAFSMAALHSHWAFDL
jgi:hypothetical protein